MKDFDRRQFLAAVSASLTPAAFAQPVPGKIRVGILGVQHSHLRGKLQAMYDNPDYEVVCACEPDEATRRAAGKNPLVQRLPFVSKQEMLSDPSLHLVVFEGEVKDAVPSGMEVLKAGKHLHVEKPPSDKLPPFRAMIEAAKERDRRVQVGYLWRFNDGFEAALDAYRKGWLGEVFMIRATINSDRDMKQRAVEARYGGGSMFELGGHVIDLVLAFLGKPTAVRPWLRHDTTIQDAEKDNTLAVLEYGSALALIVSSSRDAAVHRSLEIIGTNGSIMVDPIEPVPTMRVFLREARGPYKKSTQEIKFSPEPRFVKDFRELARAIKSGTPLRYSYDHELNLQETLLRASGEIV